MPFHSSARGLRILRIPPVIERLSPSHRFNIPKLYTIDTMFLRCRRGGGGGEGGGGRSDERIKLEEGQMKKNTTCAVGYNRYGEDNGMRWDTIRIKFRNSILPSKGEVTVTSLSSSSKLVGVHAGSENVIQIYGKLGCDLCLAHITHVV